VHLCWIVIEFLIIKNAFCILNDFTIQPARTVTQWPLIWHKEMLFMMTL